ncbi:MAG: UDP-N-acetylmuramate dehydrogenase [Halioglobus sp.]|nr:UDP-N-acetylmuramate dehydrogenase [Halioglobus sp.]
MKYYHSQDMSPYNTLRLHAQAAAQVAINNDVELVACLEWARVRSLSIVPLGEGSNVVLAGNVDALVVLQRTCGIEIIARTDDTVVLRVAAGENWHALVRWTLQQGYFGLENLALIPGTVGAAPIQNVGAYGVELQSVLLRVHARQLTDGRIIELNGKECEFGYRDSIFKHGLKDQLLITAVDLELSLHPKVNTRYPAIANYCLEHGIVSPTPPEIFDAVVSIRQSKLPDPAVEPNAGSFFKNPLLQAHEAQGLVAAYSSLPLYPQSDGRVKVSAAWMIDQCGWKGFRKEGLGVHPEHALVLVNYGSNSGPQLLSLANDIAATVRRTFGINLEIEPRVYGSRP